ncbi:uncharacterized protein [Nicotiana tomentosiformis]|uniref:uncharacterized protein n=1 Tax=Nicotiana tomentosiformis TaxID=4098 RepID=UPI00388CDDE5
MVPTLIATPPAQPVRGRGHPRHGRPRGGAHASGGQARCYAFSGKTEVVASDVVITCIVYVCHMDALVLFDPSSTYSYMSSYFASCLDMPRCSFDAHVHMFTLVFNSIVVDRVYLLCVVTICGFEMRADFLILDMVDFDVILSMDWLSLYHVILDFHAKTVTLVMSGLPRLEWKDSLGCTPSRVILFLKAQRMVEKGCLAYLAFVRDVSADTPTIESVTVVMDFWNIFLIDLSGMSPDRDIDFSIDLVPSTQPISSPPYHMAPAELKELKEQLQELLDKGFIKD